MKILIFGGTGSMGIPLVRILAENGNKVYVTSRQRKEDMGGIHYITGNAHDLNFIKTLLVKKYDALIDFMVYSAEELIERVDFLLSNVSQYVFLSSARVYADSKDALTEESDRLLDVCEDKEYLQTKEYALVKAREEDIIRQSQHKNWTIIRPYITYNYNRLQLGVFEKEYWLQRALAGKTIVFSKDIADKYTTLTFADDVSRHIAKLIGNKQAYGEIFQITSDQEVKWYDVLNLYSCVIKRETGQQIRIKLLHNGYSISCFFGNYFQIYYDRCYNRRFNSEKVNTVINDFEYKDILESLDQCLTEFLQGNKEFLSIDWKAEAFFDRLTEERTRIAEINGLKHKIMYLLYRYTPYTDWKIAKGKNK